ncbi:MAG: hypothetical protein OXU69_00955 [Gemmatimonadota bacterium]|nr:hypothetical protein [Gemmatimonadota bacterium]
MCRSTLAVSRCASAVSRWNCSKRSRTAHASSRMKTTMLKVSASVRPSVRPLR